MVRLDGCSDGLYGHAGGGSVSYTPFIIAVAMVITIGRISGLHIQKCFITSMYHIIDMYEFGVRYLHTNSTETC